MYNIAGHVLFTLIAVEKCSTVTCILNFTLTSMGYTIVLHNTRLVLCSTIAWLGNLYQGRIQGPHFVTEQALNVGVYGTLSTHSYFNTAHTSI